MHRFLGLRLERCARAIAQWSQKGTRKLLWRIPLTALGADGSREIVFGDSAGEQIVGVDGTGSTARNERRTLVERPASAASITGRTRIEGKFAAGIPPLPFELRPEEAGPLGTVLPPGA